MWELRRGLVLDLLRRNASNFTKIENQETNKKTIKHNGTWWWKHEDSTNSQAKCELHVTWSPQVITNKLHYKIDKSLENNQNTSSELVIITHVYFYRETRIYSFPRSAREWLAAHSTALWLQWRTAYRACGPDSQQWCPVRRERKWQQ